MNKQDLAKAKAQAHRMKSEKKHISAIVEALNLYFDDTFIHIGRNVIVTDKNDRQQIVIRI